MPFFMYHSYFLEKHQSIPLPFHEASTNVLVQIQHLLPLL